MKNYDCKHLTTTQRIKIEKGLLDGESFASIARKIDKYPSTIAKEVKKYRYFPERENPDKKFPCIRKSNCSMRSLAVAGCFTITFTKGSLPQGILT